MGSKESFVYLKSISHPPFFPKFPPLGYDGGNFVNFCLDQDIDSDIFPLTCLEVVDARRGFDKLAGVRFIDGHLCDFKDFVPVRSGIFSFVHFSVFSQSLLRKLRLLTVCGASLSSFHRSDTMSSFIFPITSAFLKKQNHCIYSSRYFVAIPLNGPIKRCHAIAVSVSPSATEDSAALRSFSHCITFSDTVIVHWLPYP